MTTITHETIIDEASLSDALKPRIGHENLFRDGTVSASTEALNGAVAQAYDGLTYDAWVSTGGATEWVRVQVAGSPTPSADYMAVAAHTLSGCTLTPQSSNDGSSWSDLASAFTAVNDRPIVWEFAATQANYFRLSITNAPGAVSIGAIHAGLKLTMERGLAIGFEPPSLNEDVTFTNAMSEGGQILGRAIVRRGVETDIAANNVTWLWARDDWRAFLDAANLYACFFWWVNEGRGEIVYGGVDDPKAAFVDHELLLVSFEIKGINR